MTKHDFALLENFTVSEVQRTGARIKDVKFQTMWYLQLVRKKAGRPIKLVKGGLTTGIHASKEHPDGKAVDFYLNPKFGNITFRTAVKILYAMIEVGFKGIGLYHNGNIYSFHGHIGDQFRTWSTVMIKRRVGRRVVREWQYLPLFVDPKNYKVAA